MNEFLSVTKRLAARMEIEGAIRALADHQNFLAAELLASAAIDVIAGVAKEASVITTNANFAAAIRPERLSDFTKNIRKPYNFLKHSDRDKNTAIDRYKTEAAIWRTFIAISDYTAVWKIKSATMAVFLAWFLARYPSIILDEHRGMIDNYVRMNGNLDNLPYAAALLKLKENFQTYDEVADQLAIEFNKQNPGSIEI